MELEIHKDVPIKHFGTFSRHEPFVKDNSVITTYKTCPRKYFYRYVLGLDEKDSPLYFAFGSAYHKFREALEISFKANEDIPNLNDRCDVSYVQALQEAYKTWAEESKKATPNSKWDFLTKERLKKSAEFVKKLWIKEKTIGNIIVVETEQPFSIVFENWVLGGRFDQVILWMKKLWGRDFKSSSKQDSYWSRTLTPNHQFILYTSVQSQLQGQQVQGQLVEMLHNSKTTGPSLHPHPVSFTTAQVENWKRDIRYYLTQMDYSRDNDHYPMNESHCPFCPYHAVCKSTNEQGMAAKLKDGYVFRPWNFMTVED